MGKTELSQHPNTTILFRIRTSQKLCYQHIVFHKWSCLSMICIHYCPLPLCINVSIFGCPGFLLQYIFYDFRNRPKFQIEFYAESTWVYICRITILFALAWLHPPTKNKLWSCHQKAREITILQTSHIKYMSLLSLWSTAFQAKKYLLLLITTEELSEIFLQVIKLFVTVLYMFFVDI